ncbi:MAG: T9SS type A sorting domain-containing protein, partial [Bacteroidetes bacterium]|nr:T9SS type A sorting domain-containing protein [Bacteroidota bacterium]
EFSLSYNYPNPFSRSSVITYSLPMDVHVRIDVYDLLGRMVHILEDRQMPTGEHNVTIDATAFSTGLYFYSLTAGEFSQTRKMVVVR